MEIYEMEAGILLLGYLSLVYLWGVVLFGPKEPLLAASNSQAANISTSPKPFTFDDLPPELRNMIFMECDLSWRPRCAADADPERLTAMPALVIALRPQPKPYFEILDIFYRKNVYDISFGNGYGFGWMLPSAILTIQSVDIAFVSYTPAFTEAKPSSNHYGRGSPFKFELVLTDLEKLPMTKLNPAVKEIKFYHDGHTGLVDYDEKEELHLLQRQFPRYLSRFTSLERLSIEHFAKNRHRRANPTVDYSSKNHEDMVVHGSLVDGEAVLKSFEQKNHLSGCGTSSDYWYETWEFTPDAGCVMNWRKWRVPDGLWSLNIAGIGREVVRFRTI